jgi:hypothetical protein
VPRVLPFSSHPGCSGLTRGGHVEASRARRARVQRPSHSSRASRSIESTEPQQSSSIRERFGGRGEDHADETDSAWIARIPRDSSRPADEPLPARTERTSNDFIAGLFVPIARTTGRSYSKFSARNGEPGERERKRGEGGGEREREREREREGSTMIQRRKNNTHSRTHARTHARTRPEEEARSHALRGALAE